MAQINSEENIPVDNAGLRWIIHCVNHHEVRVHYQEVRLRNSFSICEATSYIEWYQDWYITSNFYRKLFVGGLSNATTQEKLKEYFSRFGEVTDCVVMKDNATGHSRGFGFVSFKDINCVAKVLSNGPHEVDGRTIDPKVCNARSAQKKKSSNHSSVFLGGLPPNCTETDIRSFFSRYGTVVEVKLMCDKENKKTRGFGFLSFETEDSVKQVCAEHFVTINGKQVECKHAEPRTPASRAQQNNVPPNQWGGPGWGPPPGPPGGMGPGPMGPGGPPGPMNGPMGGPMNMGGGYQGGWGGPQQPGSYGPQGGWGPQQGGGYGPGYQNWGGGPGYQNWGSGPGYGPYGGSGPQYGQQGYGPGPGGYGGGYGGYNAPMGGAPPNTQPPVNDGYSGPGGNGPSAPQGPPSGTSGTGGTQSVGSYSQAPSNYGPSRGIHGNGYGGPGSYGGGQGNYNNQNDSAPPSGRAASQNPGYHPYRR